MTINIRRKATCRGPRNGQSHLRTTCNQVPLETFTQADTQAAPFGAPVSLRSVSSNLADSIATAETDALSSVVQCSPAYSAGMTDQLSSSRAPIARGTLKFTSRGDRSTSAMVNRQAGCSSCANGLRCEKRSSYGVVGDMRISIIHARTQSVARALGGAGQWTVAAGRDC